MKVSQHVLSIEIHFWFYIWGVPGPFCKELYVCVGKDAQIILNT